MFDRWCVLSCQQTCYFDVNTLPKRHYVFSISSLSVPHVLPHKQPAPSTHSRFQQQVSSQLPTTDVCFVIILRKLRSLKLLIAQNICNMQIPISTPICHRRFMSVNCQGEIFRRVTYFVIHRCKLLSFISVA
jgi:hypothetical protein